MKTQGFYIYAFDLDLSFNSKLIKGPKLSCFIRVRVSKIVIVQLKTAYFSPIN